MCVQQQRRVSKINYIEYSWAIYSLLNKFQVSESVLLTRTTADCIIFFTHIYEWHLNDSKSHCRYSFLQGQILQVF